MVTLFQTDLQSLRLHDDPWSVNGSSFLESSKEHVLDLISVPGPHVTEHDHSLHSLNALIIAGKIDDH